MLQHGIKSDIVLPNMPKKEWKEIIAAQKPKLRAERQPKREFIEDIEQKRGTTLEKIFGARFSAEKLEFSSFPIEEPLPSVEKNLSDPSTGPRQLRPPRVADHLPLADKTRLAKEYKFSTVRFLSRQPEELKQPGRERNTGAENPLDRALEEVVVYCRGVPDERRAALLAKISELIAKAEGAATHPRKTGEIEGTQTPPHPESREDIGQNDPPVGAPKWHNSIGSYQNEDLRSAEFKSVEEADKAIDLFWDDPELKGAPREIVNARTLILPEEVMQLLRHKPLVFEAKPLLAAEEISVEELTALRRKHGI